MDRMRALLAKYPDILDITIDRSGVHLYVADFNKFVTVLEKNCFDLKQVRECGTIDFSFDVSAKDDCGFGRVSCPHTSAHTLFKNLLLH